MIRFTDEQFEAHQRLHGRARKVRLIASDTPVRPKKARKKQIRVPCPTESQEQAKVIEWFDSYAPTKNLDPRLLFAIPNGSHKSPAAAMKFKREGLRSGVMDLMLARPKSERLKVGEVLGPQFANIKVHHIVCAGLYVEMKRIRGSVTSPEQLEMKQLFEAQGYRVVICKGAGEAIKAIEEYLA